MSDEVLLDLSSFTVSNIDSVFECSEELGFFLIDSTYEAIVDVTLSGEVTLKMVTDEAFVGTHDV